ncbi:DUF5658 family protein [Pyrodictium abyssi]|uniref:DUF5658 domain-containing protein n=1 Tax=Pyrodictium abyssi TaxID=54256 RepID=A0ABN6ZTR2_9CREN|nr:hypothetical protein PABY_17920 [Pyrodictium abyssi]
MQRQQPARRRATIPGPATSGSQSPPHTPGGHSHLLFYALLVFTILHIADMYTTLLCIESGVGVEANTIAALFASSPLGLLLFTMLGLAAFTGLTLAAMLYMEKYQSFPLARPIGYAVVYAHVLGKLVTVANNTLVYLGHPGLKAPPPISFFLVTTT